MFMGLFLSYSQFRQIHTNCTSIQEILHSIPICIIHFEHNNNFSYHKSINTQIEEKTKQQFITFVPMASEAHNWYFFDNDSWSSNTTSHISLIISESTRSTILFTIIFNGSAKDLVWSTSNRYSTLSINWNGIYSL